jgi:hypothetical protein
MTQENKVIEVVASEGAIVQDSHQGFDLGKLITKEHHA